MFNFPCFICVGKKKKKGKGSGEDEGTETPRPDTSAETPAPDAEVPTGEDEEPDSSPPQVKTVSIFFSFLLNTPHLRYTSSQFIR